ncbi:hypothetical protein AB0H00_00710 [Nocardia sp. NPDC023852]|uniref:hypothetical protein n=1 Tax=Nocardia sp. NPDC023852 TaxID=3154697 RepID=UPI0033E3CF01
MAGRVLPLARVRYGTGTLGRHRWPLGSRLLLWWRRWRDALAGPGLLWWGGGMTDLRHPRHRAAVGAAVHVRLFGIGLRQRRAAFPWRDGRPAGRGPVTPIAWYRPMSRYVIVAHHASCTRRDIRIPVGVVSRVSPTP